MSDSFVLKTASQIIEYVKDLSDFIDAVKITDVKPGMFSFKVKVPFWYRTLYGWRLKRIIQKRVAERIVVGVKFNVSIYSEHFF